MSFKNLLICGVMTAWLTGCAPGAVIPAPTGVPSPAPVATLQPSPTPVPEPQVWLSDAILYEVYPRSFYDSDGNGVGDLRGIALKLDYIQSLGINTLWLTPIFSSTSPFGSDVTSFYKIAPDLGTGQDLAELTRQAHSRQMRVIVDMPIAYTSNELPQFKEAYGKPDSRYGDWYQWQNNPHTAYRSFANLRSLPLLNHTSTAVQAYLVEVARHWLGMGVDGLRLGDATSVPHDFWKVFGQAIKQANSTGVLLGEAWESDPKKLAPYFQDEFDALFDVPLYYALAGDPDRNGGGLLNGRGSPNSLDAALSAPASYSPTAQLVRFASAHNTNRIASLVGQHTARQRLAAVLLLTLPGPLSIYYGEEIGMPGSLGSGPLANEYRRAPMDWAKSGKGAGMTTWFKDAGKVNKPDDGISVEEQQNTKDSLWSLYRLLTTHRTGHPALRGPNLQRVTSACKTCYAYLRWDAKDLYLVAFNFSNDTQSVTFDLAKLPRPVAGPGQDLLRGGNVSLPSDGRYTLTMNPWDARVVYWGK